MTYGDMAAAGLAGYVGLKLAWPYVQKLVPTPQPAAPVVPIPDDYNPKRPDSPNIAVFRFCQLRKALEADKNYAALEAIQPAWALLMPAPAKPTPPVTPPEVTS